MKKTQETETNNSELTEDQIIEMENDTLWDLVDKANQPIKTNTQFSNKIMREIRELDENEDISSNSTSLSNLIIFPNFVKYSFAVAAACALLVITMSNSDQNDAGSPAYSSKSIDIEFINDIPLESLPEYSENTTTAFTEDTFAAEMLEFIDQDPLFLSEEDIDLAMNF